MKTLLRDASSRLGGIASAKHEIKVCDQDDSNIPDLNSLSETARRRGQAIGKTG